MLFCILQKHNLYGMRMFQSLLSYIILGSYSTSAAAAPLFSASTMLLLVTLGIVKYSVGLVCNGIKFL
jgi:hypothetical protein